MILFEQPIWNIKKKKMTTETYDLQKALKLSVMLGAALMENGAEIYRVEESILFFIESIWCKTNRCVCIAKHHNSDD